MLRTLAHRFVLGRLALCCCCVVVLLATRHARAQVEGGGMCWNAPAFTGVIAYSPAQPLIATVQGFGEIACYQPDGALVQTIATGQTAGFSSLAFTADGETLAAGSPSGSVQLWRVSDGTCLQTLNGSGGSILSVAFAADGQTLAAGSESGIVQTWQVSDGTPLQTFTGHTGPVLAVAFTPDGQTLASGSGDMTIKLWNVSNGTCLQTLTGHTSWVTSLAITPDGKTLASGSWDDTIKLWSISNGTCLQTLTGHNNGVSCVALTPDGQTLASGSLNDGIVKFWRMSDGACLQTFTAHWNSVTSLAFAPDGQTLASAGEFDGTIKCWQVSDAACLQTIDEQSATVYAACYTPDGQTLATGCNDDTIICRQVTDGTRLCTLTGHQGPVYSLSITPDGQTLASASADSTIKLWRMSDDICLQTLTGHLLPVTGVSFAPDGQTLVSGSEDGTVKLWRVSDGACLHTLTGHTDEVMSVAFSPDGATVASGSMDETIKLWRVSDGTCLQTLTGHTATVESVAYSPDGLTLASAGADMTIKLWRVSDGSCQYTLTGHTDRVLSVAFSPDGQTLASGSSDKTIKLWDLSEESCLATLTGHTGEVYTVAIAPAGNTLASGGWYDGVALWNLFNTLSAVTLTPSQPAPQSLNTPITLTAAATGGTNLQYQFWVYNAAATPAWSQLQGYSSSAACTWTPATAGNYLLSATAQDGLTGTTVNTTLWYQVITPPLTAVSLSASPTSPQLVNTPITLSATAAGGTNVLFQFWLYTPGASPAWSQLQAYSSSAVCAWTPTAPGSYLLSTTACDGVTGAELNTLAWYTIAVPLSAVSVTASPALPQPANTPITFSATATGGANLQYQFWLYNVADTPAWSQVQAYSASATCMWIPPASGSYQLAVTACDNTTGATVNTTLSFIITIPLTALSVSATPASPQFANTPITLTAAATGGYGVQYQFWLYCPGALPAWTQLQSYSSSATCAWTTQATGNCMIAVTARDSISGVEVTTPLWFTVAAPLSSVALATSPVAPQPANIPITLTASATGGANVQYQFGVYTQNATPALSLLQAYSSSATCVWTPQAPGSYQLSVTARDTLSGTVVTNTLWDTVSVASPLTAVSVSASPASPHAVNTPITLTATATGGANVRYQFWLYNANATPAWSQLQSYSSAAACQWTPASAGNYLLAVTAQDGVTGTEVNTTLWYAITGGPLLSAVNVTAAPASPQAANTPITLTATATGGTSVQYQFWLYAPSATPAWNQLQSYSSTAVCLWTPATAGTYQLAVTARDGVTGAEVNTTLWYTVTVGPPLSAVSVTASPVSPQPANTAITLTASATGGTNMQYQFWLYTPNATPAWSQLQAYAASATCTWTPSTAGSYLISATAQDGAIGTEVSTTLWYTVQ